VRSVVAARKRREYGWGGKILGGGKRRGEGVVGRNRGEKGGIKGEYGGEWAAELSHT